MRLPRFEYLEPKDLDQALDMLAQYKDDARILAGGTDLLVRMKKRLLMPKKLISLKTLNFLSHITQNKDSITIGACTSLAHIIESSLIQKEFPALFSAMELLGAPTIQHYTGTIGGNILQDI